MKAYTLNALNSALWKTVQAQVPLHQTQACQCSQRTFVLWVERGQWSIWWAVISFTNPMDLASAKIVNGIPWSSASPAWHHPKSLSPFGDFLTFFSLSIPPPSCYCFLAGPTIGTHWGNYVCLFCKQEVWGTRWEEGQTVIGGEGTNSMRKEW